MNPDLYLPLFLGIVVLQQGFLTLWSYRASGSTPTALLVGLLPLVGLPYQLWQLRDRLVDNHIAGGLAYLALMVSAGVFYFYRPHEDIPWMLIFTMCGFAFLGAANLIGTALKE